MIFRGEGKRISDFRNKESRGVLGDDDKVQAVTVGGRWSSSTGGGHRRLGGSFTRTPNSLRMMAGLAGQENTVSKCQYLL